MIEPNRKGEVWVFAEQEDEHLSDTSLELCGKARELADTLGVKVGAVLVGLERARAVVPADRPRRGQGLLRARHAAGALPHAAVRPGRCASSSPSTSRRSCCTGRRRWAATWRPRIASEMRAGLTADCTDLQIGDYTDPQTKKEYRNLLHQIRPAFGGNIIATIINYDRWPQMATVREGVMRLGEGDPRRKGEIIEEKIEFNDFDDGGQADRAAPRAAQGEPQGRAGSSWPAAAASAARRISS